MEAVKTTAPMAAPAAPPSHQGDRASRDPIIDTREPRPPAPAVRLPLRSQSHQQLRLALDNALRALEALRSAPDLRIGSAGTSTASVAVERAREAVAQLGLVLEDPRLPRLAAASVTNARAELLKGIGELNVARGLGGPDRTRARRHFEQARLQLEQVRMQTDAALVPVRRMGV